MPDNSNKFHEFALKSILFKGQHDLYFCYVKSEKIAHVLAILQSKLVVQDAAHIEGLVHSASRLPETIAHFAAGEIELGVVLADLFCLLSAVRLSSTHNVIHKENARVIIEEYEVLAQKLVGGSQLSPFVTSEDFLLPPMPENTNLPSRSLLNSAAKPELHVKDIKGQYKGHQEDRPANNKGQSVQMDKRTSLILAFVVKHQGSSIKDIGKVIRDCSEKTIQRELTLLIEQGLVEKRGERRWSVYYPR